MITQVPSSGGGGHDPSKSASPPSHIPPDYDLRNMSRDPPGQSPYGSSFQSQFIETDASQELAFVSGPHQGSDASGASGVNPQQGSESKPEVVFWGDDPNVLLRTPYLLEFFPTESMTYAQKLNAIARTVLIVAIIISLWSGQWARTGLVTALTLSAIYLMYMHYTGRAKDPEGFATPTSGPVVDAMRGAGTKGHPLPPTTDDIFQDPSSQNPFSNVLVPDYELNPHKLPAPPVDRPEVSNQIMQQAVNLVQEANPSQPGITEKLFRDVNDQLTFEQSMRPFMSNPATTIPNDQGAFAQFCYGSMVSCKEGNLFACARNTSHYNNY